MFMAGVSWTFYPLFAFTDLNGKTGADFNAFTFCYIIYQPALRLKSLPYMKKSNFTWQDTFSSG